ncbi:MAG: hypothetical protein IAB19_04885 [Proteobacteria bacterium]|uniref:Uncharacterized protein n=1 Tax=Candidatus Avisuccinivibrio stercorigallinarum TaxID=2840704 RepID=A0A9D9DC33_9GAMM|nr:hypothetical protein [Candidatus Avisuccinivibrio stercorigallinarum]
MVKACCIQLMSDDMLALTELDDSFVRFPYRVWLDPITSLYELSDEAVSRVLCSLGLVNLEVLYGVCAQRALRILQQKIGSSGSGQQSSQQQVRFFASGLVNLAVDGMDDGYAASRAFNFNAILDGPTKIPTAVRFAEPDEDELQEIERCRGRKASKEVAEMRAAALIDMLNFSSESGVLLELEKALCTEQVFAAAAQAGIEVVPRKVGRAALVQRPGGWVLWEMLVNRIHFCSAQFLKNDQSCRSVCFILMLSLMLWYYLGARVTAACHKLGVQEFELSGPKMPLTRKNFRSYVQCTRPGLMVLKDRHITNPVNISKTLASIVNELGPCYQRYLMAETYNGRQLSEDF